MTDRDKKAARSVCALEDIWKELQPGIIAVHDQLPFAIFKVLCLDLRKPSVLSRECRSGIRFGKVENYVYK